MEKIYKKEDGSKVKLIVDFNFSFNRNNSTYRINVYLCAPNKRKYIKVDSDDWEYRNLSMEDRRKANMVECMKYITEDQLYSVCHLAWNEMKPTFKNIESF
jgi:hypothetical protein